MSLAETDKLISEISISKFLQAQAPPGYTINKVNVYTSKYFSSLSGILKSTDRKTLHDYLEWGLVRALLSGLHKDLISPWVQFKNSMGIREAIVPSERWKTCLAEIDTELGWIESGFFVQHAFSREAKEFGERIIGDLKDEFAQRFQTTSWMSNAAKAAAVNKGRIDRFLCIY
jgi:endothelin-converting enzyme